MPKLQFLIIHCTATRENLSFFKSDIIRWHTSAVSEGGRGWSKVGYSDMIELGGALVNLSSYNNDDDVDAWEVTNGVKGKNSISRHIVYVGGCDENGNPKNTLTEKQKATLDGYLKKTLGQHPNVKVAGHNQFAAKACPSFDVPKYCKSIGIAAKNIYKP